MRILDKCTDTTANNVKHHDDDPHFTGRIVSHYENGVEVSCEQLRTDCCFGTLPEFIELLTSCGYQVIQGVHHVQ